MTGLAASAALLAMAACSSDTAMLDADAGVSPQALVKSTTAAVERTVSYKPALGPPDHVNAELARSLNAAALEQGIALIVDPKVAAELTLRGYVSAMRKGSIVNLTYVWDVVDAQGQRVTRVTGEETLPVGTDPSQPWTAVTPAASRMLALKTMGEIGRWAKSNSVAAGRSNLAAGNAGGSSGMSGAGVASGAASLAPQARPE